MSGRGGDEGETTRTGGGPGDRGEDVVTRGGGEGRIHRLRGGGRGKDIRGSWGREKKVG